jgi:ADP-heptose:LPS heptosyltransferase
MMKVGVMRYAGAWGDMIQVSSVLAGFKDQGHHVTLITAGPAVDIIRHDPNIDVLEIDEEFFKTLTSETARARQAKYDKLVSLQGSIEISLLSSSKSFTHLWSPAFRHKIMNVNQLERVHEIAGLPHNPQVRFFPTEEEFDWASKFMQGINAPVLVGMAVKGSGAKFWHGFDPVIRAILKHFPSIHIVLFGGDDARPLLQDWSTTPQVHDLMGRCSMREACTLAMHCGLVIGMDTGLMHSVSQMSNVKLVILLGTVTHECITRDWVNTRTFASKNTICFGRGNNEAPACHMLHNDWTFCKEDKATGCAQCLADLHPNDVWASVKELLDPLKEDHEDSLP